MKLAAGLILALLSAGALNWGYVTQHTSASALPPLSLRRPIASLLLLFRDRRWVVGLLVGIAGWVLYVAALALASLSLVQAASAGGLPLLALLARRHGADLSRRQWLAVGAAAAGLFLLAVSLTHGGAGSAHARAADVAVWIVVSAAAAAAAATADSTLLAGGAGLGIAAGVLYASGDIATKAAVSGVARLPFVAVLLLAHGAAFVCLQLGFQRGGALATAGPATLLTNSLPIVAGLALFGDHLPGGPLGVARVAAFAAVVVGAALLAADVSAQPRPASS